MGPTLLSVPRCYICMCEVWWLYQRRQKRKSNLTLMPKIKQMSYEIPCWHNGRLHCQERLKQARCNGLAVTQPPKVLADRFLPICQVCYLLGHHARASHVLPQAACWCKEKATIVCLAVFLAYCALWRAGVCIQGLRTFAKPNLDWHQRGNENIQRRFYTCVPFVQNISTGLWKLFDHPTEGVEAVGI